MSQIVFRPSRLKLARHRRMVTKTALAEMVGLSSVRMITEYESGRSEPQGNTLTRIAHELNFPLEFFWAPDPERIDKDNVSFRALSRLTARQRDAAIGAGMLATEFHDWIAKKFRLPAPQLPNLEGADPERASQMIREEWGLGERPISNMVHLVEAHGVRVFSLEEQCAEVDAFSCWHAGLPFMFLNMQKPGERSRMDSAHELGHLVMHRGHAAPRGRDVEREAKIFASALLMPKADVVGVMSGFSNPTLNQLVKLKKRWKVSIVALVYRLEELQILSEWQSRLLWAELSRKGMRTKEPEPKINQETSLILKKVFAALRKEGISRSDIAQALHIPITELNAFLFGHAMLSVQGEHLQNGRKTTPPDLHLVAG